LALEEVKKQVNNEFTSGSNSNDNGKYNFSIKA